MPIYEYRCEKGHTFEVSQRMSDDTLTECLQCGAPVQRVFHPVAIHFKGKGFYNTDYGKRSRGASKDGEGAGGGSDGAKPKPKEPAASTSNSDSGSSKSPKSSKSSSSSD